MLHPRLLSVSGIVALLSLLLFIAVEIWREPLKRRGIYVFASLNIAFGLMFVASWMTDRSGLPTILFGLGFAGSLCQVLAALWGSKPR
jgi:hypothetical protein